MRTQKSLLVYFTELTRVTLLSCRHWIFQHEHLTSTHYHVEGHADTVLDDDYTSSIAIFGFPLSFQKCLLIWKSIFHSKFCSPQEVFSLLINREAETCLNLMVLQILGGFEL